MGQIVLLCHPVFLNRSSNSCETLGLPKKRAHEMFPRDINDSSYETSAEREETLTLTGKLLSARHRMCFTHDAVLNTRMVLPGYAQPGVYT